MRGNRSSLGKVWFWFLAIVSSDILPTSFKVSNALSRFPARSLFLRSLQALNTCFTKPICSTGNNILSLSNRTYKSLYCLDNVFWQFLATWPCWIWNQHLRMLLDENYWDWGCLIHWHDYAFASAHVKIGVSPKADLQLLFPPGVTMKNASTDPNKTSRT